MSFPAKTADGKTVQIVSKETAGELVVLVDELGNRYTTEPHAAHVLIDYAEKVVGGAESLLENAEAFENEVVTKAEGYLSEAETALTEVEVEAYPGGDSEADPESEPEVPPAEDTEPATEELPPAA